MPHVRVYEPGDFVIQRRAIVVGSPIAINQNSYQRIAITSFDLDTLKITGITPQILLRAILQSSSTARTVYLRLYNSTDAEIITGSEVSTNQIVPTYVSADITSYFTGKTGLKIIEAQSYISAGSGGQVWFCEVVMKGTVVIK